jgi:hypothetical protein
MRRGITGEMGYRLQAQRVSMSRICQPSVCDVGNAVCHYGYSDRHDLPAQISAPTEQSVRPIGSPSTTGFERWIRIYVL